MAASLISLDLDSTSSYVSTDDFRNYSGNVDTSWGYFPYTDPFWYRDPQELEPEPNTPTVLRRRQKTHLETFLTRKMRTNEKGKSVFCRPVAFHRRAMGHKSGAKRKLNRRGRRDI